MKTLVLEQAPIVIPWIDHHKASIKHPLLNAELSSTPSAQNASPIRGPDEPSLLGYLGFFSGYPTSPRQKPVTGSGQMSSQPLRRRYTASTCTVAAKQSRRTPRCR